MAERKRLDPYPLAGYTWSTWLAPAYRPKPEAASLADAQVGQEKGREDELDDSEEIGEEE